MEHGNVFKVCFLEYLHQNCPEGMLEIRFLTHPELTDLEAGDGAPKIHFLKRHIGDSDELRITHVSV